MTDRIAPPRTYTPPVLLSRDEIAGVTVSIYQTRDGLHGVTLYNGLRDEWAVHADDRATARHLAALARGTARHGTEGRVGPVAVYSSVGGAR